MRTPALVLVALAVACGSGGASGSSKYAGTTDAMLFEEGLGFPGVCPAPCFSVLVEAEVWGPNDPANPLPLPGNLTFTYVLTHEGGEGAFVPEVFEFEVVVDSDFVTDVGVLDGGGVAPAAFSIEENANVVSWEFLPNLLGYPEFSQLLFIHSPLDAGYVEASLSGQASLTATGETVGPVPEPSAALGGLAACLTLGLLRRKRANA